MSKFIINLLDGEEGTYELEGDRLIVAVGGQDRTDVSIGVGKERKEQALLIADIMALMKDLKERKPMQLMAAIELIMKDEKVVIKAVRKEDAN